MASKRKNIGDGNRATKKRSVLTLHEKVEILDRLRSGARVSTLAKDWNINESSVRTIRQNEEKIRASVQASSNISAKIAQVPRRIPQLEQVEKMLIAWIDDQVNEKGSVLDAVAIRNKALELFQYLLSKEGGTADKEFQASKGWFENFKKRFNLNNLKLHRDAGSPDKEAAAKFKPEFYKLIGEKGYLPQQVFNADETGLFYKQMGERTYVSKESDTAPLFKAFKDRLTLLFCSNASGDFKCKPLLVHRAKIPRALHGKDLEQLPVVWKWRKTKDIFTEWFQDSFIKEVKQYLERENLSFKVLLIIDDAPGHDPETLKTMHPNVEVLFFPPNTNSLIQPMDQGIIKTFKAHYDRLVYASARKALDEGQHDTLMSFWKHFNVGHCIEAIKIAWDQVSRATANGCWHQLWPQIVDKDIPTVENESEELAGDEYGDEAKEQFNYLLIPKVEYESDEESTRDDEFDDPPPLPVKEEPPEESMTIKEEPIDDPEEESEDPLTINEVERQNPQFIENLSTLLKMAAEVCRFATEFDSNGERVRQFVRGIQDVCAPYSEALMLASMHETRGNQYLNQFK